jgi:hypothetical protein
MSLLPFHLLHHNNDQDLQVIRDQPSIIPLPLLIFNATITRLQSFESSLSLNTLEDHVLRLDSQPRHTCIQLLPISTKL